MSRSAENAASSIGFLAGCLRSVAIIVGLAIALPLGTCTWRHWSAPYGQLPPSIDHERIVQWSEKHGLSDYCFEAVYELTPDSTALLRQKGLSILQRSDPPKEDPENSYGLWRATPLPFVRVRKSGYDAFEAQPDGKGPSFALFATTASGGCEGQTKVPASIYKMLQEPGSFYTINGNADGMIVIDAKRGTAVVLYSTPDWAQ